SAAVKFAAKPQVKFRLRRSEALLGSVKFLPKGEVKSYKNEKTPSVSLRETPPSRGRLRGKLLPPQAVPSLQREAKEAPSGRELAP
ncbi:MAG: hypothetical protein IJR89_08605, partial [Clostridia bacterium]|nr:hypothetical protein [Clostridia bacterium]